MLRECLKNLGYENPEIQHAGWVLERNEAISRLHDICGKFGDNDWDESLHLADIIEKHLACYIEAN
jgi:hypothetical protein